MKTGTGIKLIAAERERQIHEEGWNVEHDDAHRSGELNDAAVAYAQAAAKQSRGESLEFLRGMIDGLPGCPWPWESAWWKPSADPIRNLVKAGALIAAEIDRLERLPKINVAPRYTQGREFVDENVQCDATALMGGVAG